MRWTGTARPAASTQPRPRGRTGDTPVPIPTSSATQLFAERGVDVAILHPMTRGMLPDRHLGTAIAGRAQRDDGVALAGGQAYADRYRGTIRVNPEDITGALREIDK